MSELFDEVIGGHRVINRPLQHDELDDDLEYGHESPYSDLDNYVRQECLDCGLEMQGHIQVVDLGWWDDRCPHDPNKDRVDERLERAVEDLFDATAVEEEGES